MILKNGSTSGAVPSGTTAVSFNRAFSLSDCVITSVTLPDPMPAAAAVKESPTSYTTSLVPAAVFQFA